MTIEKISQESQSQILAATNLAQLNDLRVQYLGKNGLLTKMMSQIKDVADSEKKTFGQRINDAKNFVNKLIENKQAELEEAAFIEKISQEKLDLTLSGRARSAGSIHPISQTIEELITIFARLGFSLEHGPSIESDWYNFTALNIPLDHPSRQMHDTFYLPNALLRTHTSPVQIRAMERSKPPLRFISFGRTYRCDSDMTHTPMFHQLEALMVDKDVNMGHLKYTLTSLIRLFFERDDIEVRMRPSFFPFTFASAEIDIRMPGSDKWLEVLGSGLIHPQVLKNANIDHQACSGFALGLGIERFAMLKYGIKDLREFFESDYNWLKHFSFSYLHKISLEGRLGA